MKKKIKIALNCCGPAPELSGILHHLKTCHEGKNEEIDVHFYDKNDWNETRKINKEYLRKTYSTYMLHFNDHDGDLLTTKDNENSFDIVTFQFCMNELLSQSDDNDQLFQKIYKYVVKLNKNGLIIIIERAAKNQYSQTTGIYKEVEEFLDHFKKNCGLELIKSDRDADIIEIDTKYKTFIPEIIKNVHLTRWADDSTGEFKKENRIIANTIRYYSYIYKKK